MSAGDDISARQAARLRNRNNGRRRMASSKENESSFTLNSELNKHGPVKLAECDAPIDGNWYCKIENKWSTFDTGIEHTVKTMMSTKAIGQANSVLTFAGTETMLVNEKAGVMLDMPLGPFSRAVRMARKMNLGRVEAGLNPGTAVVLVVSDDDFNTILESMESEGFVESIRMAMYRGGIIIQPVVSDSKGRGVVFQIGDDITIALASTEVNGGGKSTLTMGERKVFGPVGTISSIDNIMKIIDVQRQYSNGRSTFARSIGGTSKDASLHRLTRVGSDATMNLERTWTMMGSQDELSPDNLPFATEEKMLVALLVGFAPGMTTASQHVVYAGSDHSTRRSMELDMLLQHLVHGARLAPLGHLDRQDYISRIIEFCSDLGSGHPASILSDSHGDGISQVRDVWLAAGAAITSSRLESIGIGDAGESEVEGMVSDMFSKQFRLVSSARNGSFNPQAAEWQRRAMKALVIEILLPEDHGLTARQQRRIETVFAEAIIRRFKESDQTPKLKIIMYELPKHVCPDAHITTYTMTHTRDIVQLLVLDVQDIWGERVRVHHSVTNDKDRLNSQMHRHRIDRAIAVIEDLGSSQSTRLWAIAANIVRNRIFRGGWGDGTVRCEAAGMDEK